MEVEGEEMFSFQDTMEADTEDRVVDLAVDMADDLVEASAVVLEEVAQAAADELVAEAHLEVGK